MVGRIVLALVQTCVVILALLTNGLAMILVDGTGCASLATELLKSCGLDAGASIVMIALLSGLSSGHPCVSMGDGQILLHTHYRTPRGKFIAGGSVRLGDVSEKSCFL